MLKLFFSFPSDCAPCCDTCPTEGDLDSDNTGFTDCECFQGTDLSWYAIVGHTSITGPQTVPFLMAGEWNGVIGTVTVQKYTAEGCEFEDGVPFDVNVIEDIACEDSVNTVFISAPGSVLPAGGAMFLGSGAFGDVIANTLGCGDGVAAFLDTVVVSIP